MRCATHAWLLSAAALLSFSGPLHAQGVTTATVDALVTDGSGGPVVGARFEVVHTGTGVTFHSVTDGSGRVLLPYMPPGGPYEITVEGGGFGAVRETDVTLVSGELYRVSFFLPSVGEEWTNSRRDRLGKETLDPARSGLRSRFAGDDLAAFPMSSRNFMEVATLSPVVSGTRWGPKSGASIAGLNPRFNAVLIDGARFEDAFGFADNGILGGQADGVPMPLGAVAELQVLAAPFDVRYGGFTGGVINAVTKSGTNEWQGSVTSHLHSDAVQRDSLEFASFGDAPALNQQQSLAFTLGGPLVRDKVHFFSAGELALRKDRNALGFEDIEPAAVQVPFGGGQPLPILSHDTDELSRIAAERYGIDLGETGRYTNERRALTLFGKLDWRLSAGDRLTIENTFSDARRDRSPGHGKPYLYADNSNRTFQASSAPGQYTNRTNTTVAHLYSQGSGRWKNEAKLSVQLVRDALGPRPEFGFPLITIGRYPGPLLGYGTDAKAQANELSQNVFSFSDVITAKFDRHRVTVGMDVEHRRIRRLDVESGGGQWFFSDAGGLQSGSGYYSVRIPHPDEFPLGTSLDDVAGRFSVTTPGAFVQDEVHVSPSLTLTAGLRVDAPSIGGTPRANDLFQGQLGVPTDRMPSAKVLLQPRFAFHWSGAGRYPLQVRGGAGVFAGRPSYAWIADAFTHTGRSTSILTCSDLTYDPDAVPQACADGRRTWQDEWEVNVVDDDFAFPTELKVDVGLDRKWRNGWHLTAEAIYSKGLHRVALEQANIAGPSGASVDPLGIGVRPIYDSPLPRTYSGEYANVRSEDFNSVLNLTNVSKGQSYVLFGELGRDFEDGSFRGSYTYTRSEDVMSLTSQSAIRSFSESPISGEIAPDVRPVTRSDFDTPNRFTFTGTFSRWAKHGGPTVSVTYRGQSGRPYSYVYANDVNWDGHGDEFDWHSESRGNDLVYLPYFWTDLNITDGQTLLFLQRMSALDPCIYTARVGILARNACRNPWVNALDLRVTQRLGSSNGGAQLLIDVFNVLNLISSDRGVVRATPAGTVSLLSANGRPGEYLRVYYAGPTQAGQAVLPFEVDQAASRWRINVGLRLQF